MILLDIIYIVAFCTSMCAATRYPLEGDVELECGTTGTVGVIDWQHSVHDDVIGWVSSAGILTGDHYQGRDITLDTPGGKLTLRDLRFDDGGRFTCWYDEKVTTSPKRGETHLVEIYVPAADLTPSGLSSPTVEAGTSATLTLTVGRILPTANIFWAVNGTRQQTTQKPPESNEDGTLRLEGSYAHTFSKNPEYVHFSYVITEGDINSEADVEDDYRTVRVLYKPETRVVKEQNKEIEGESFTLTCEVTDARPPANGPYEWKKGTGVIEGQTGSTYTIPSLDHTEHDGDYTCRATNDVGDGEHGTKATINVMYITSVTAEKTSSASTVEGYELKLSCSFVGYPLTIVTVQWKKRGSDDVIDTTAEVTIPSVSPSDSGSYFCAIDNGIESLEQSNDVEVNVLYGPKDAPSLTISPVETPVNTDTTFTCSPGSNQGNPEATYAVIYISSNVIHNDTSPLTTQFDSVLQGGSVTCEVSNLVASSPKSEEKTLTVRGTAFIESPTSDENLSPIYPQDDLILTCTASGHERSLSWSKGSGTVPSDLFDEETETLTAGPYEYDQTEALESTLTWRKPAATCEEVNKHDGQYTCEAAVSIGGKQSTDDVSYNVNVRYGPVSKQGPFYKDGTGLGKTIELKCDSCSNPPQRTYTWSRAGSELGSNITGADTDTLIIYNVEQEDFDNYTCHVCNNIDSTDYCEDLLVELVPYGRPSAPGTLAVEADTSRTLLVTWKPGFDGGLDQTFRLQGRKAGERDYQEVAEGIGDNKTIDYRVTELNEEPLESDTEYEFRVRAENDHPDENERDSPWAETDGSTLKTPIVRVTSDIDYDYSQHSVTFSWEVEQGKPTELQLIRRDPPSKRSISADNDWVVMVRDLDPNDGSYDGRVEDGSELERSRSYEMGLRAVELDVTTNPGEDYIVPKEKEIGGLSDGAIAGIVIGCLLLVAVPLLVVGFLMRQRQMKDARSDTNLALPRENDYTENGNNGFSIEFENNAVQTQAAPEHKMVVESSMEETPYAQVSKPKPTDRSKMPMPAIPDQTPQKPKWEYEDPPSDMEEIPEEEENPYGSAPPVPDRYYAGDFYANVDENGEKLYDPDYRCPPGEESDYWEFAGEMRKPGEKPVRISYFKETIYQRFYWYEWPMSEAELENYG